MFIWCINRYKKVLLLGFSFYLGCLLATFILYTDCNAVSNNSYKTDISFLENNIQYVALVLSSPNHKANRDVIRYTWGNLLHNLLIVNHKKLTYIWNLNSMGAVNHHSSKNVKLYFVVGTANLSKNTLQNLNLENSDNQDILFLNEIEDVFENLTKKLLLAIKWMYDYIKNIKYIIKCDDDSYVRIDLMVKELEANGLAFDSPATRNHTSKKVNGILRGLYWGYFDGRANVYKNGKYKENEWFLCDNYLPYALGGGYVISYHIIKFIALNHKYLSCYHSEDVSMGVWTAALEGINRVHDIRFDTQWTSRGCNNHMLIRHKQGASEMKEMHRNLILSKGQKLCSAENILRKPYTYDWFSKPSLCCKR